MGDDRAQALRADPLVSTPRLPVSAGSTGEASKGAASREEPSLPPVEIARIAFVAVAMLVSWRGFWAPVDRLGSVPGVGLGVLLLRPQVGYAAGGRRAAVERSLA